MEAELKRETIRKCDRQAIAYIKRGADSLMKALNRDRRRLGYFLSQLTMTTAIDKIILDSPKVPSGLVYVHC